MGRLLVVVFVAGLQGGDPGAAMRSMIEAERAFARMSVEVNQRDAFLAFFAPGGVHFQPEPGNAREALAARPVPARPKARVLDWEPAVAAMAASGDLGFSTGPFTLVDAEEGRLLGEGWFFSIWQREPDGPWRVAADIGVPAPGSGPLRPRDPVALAAPAATPRPGGGAAGSDGIPEVERRFCAELEGKPAAEAYAAWSGPDTRVYRAGRQPIVGVEAIRAAVKGSPGARWRPVGGGLSRAADFAYVYGTWQAVPAGGAGASAGGYLRVWRHTGAGWRLAADVIAGR